jgi:hypothetical protein
MALNLAKIKERLNKPKGENAFEKTDYAKIYWKPKLGEQVIRVVPSKFAPEDTHQVVRYHKFDVFKRTVYSLKNWREDDPVEKLVQKLYDENRNPNTKPADKLENEKLLSKIKPGQKYVFQVLVRGEEEKGVRLWEANATVRDIIDKLTQDADYGDITDVVNGTDLTVTGFSDTFKIGKMNKEFVNVGITPKRKASPLSKDPDLVEEYLDKQNDPFAVHKKYEYDEITTMFNKYLDPESANDVEEEEDAPKVEAPISTKYSKPVTTSKKTSLMDDDEDNDDGPKDLPWDKEKTEEEKEVEQQVKKTGTVKGGKPKSEEPPVSTKKKFAAMFDDEDDN